MEDTNKPSGSDKCGKKTNNPFFNFLRCYRTRADRQHKTAVENAVQGAREWNRMNEEQRKPFVEMAKPFLRPESELKYPRRATVGRKVKRRRRSRARSGVKTNRRGRRPAARSRSRRRTVKSRAPSRRRRTAASRRRTTTKSRTRRTKRTTKPRSRSKASTTRRRTKRRTQSCAKPYAEKINQPPTVAFELEDVKHSTIQPSCPRPTMPYSSMTSTTTPAPGTSPETPHPTKSSSMHEVTYKSEQCSDCRRLSQFVIVDVKPPKIEPSKNTCFRNDRSCPCCMPPPTDSCGGSGTQMYVNCNCTKIDSEFRKK